MSEENENSPLSGVTSNVDLRSCRLGDVLISKHGLMMTYLRPEPEGSFYDHRIKYPDGSEGTRTHEGYVFRKNRLPEDHDIVRIEHLR